MRQVSEVSVTRLTHSEAVILREILASDKHINTRHLVDALYGHREDGGPLMASNVIYKHIFRIRSKLSPAYRIDGGPWRGYHLVSS